MLTHAEQTMVQFIKSSSFKTKLYRCFFLLVAVTIILYVIQAKYNTFDEIDNRLKHWLTADDSDRTYVPVAAHTKSEPVILRMVEVKTKSGRLKGFVQNVSNTEVNTFLSVPYGEPPIGKLRFRRTKPVKKWSGVRDATQIPPPCIQSEYTQKLFPVHILNENITEDCLFMNIWSPWKKSDKLKSVMVLIHGGLFTIGSIGIDEYDGQMLSALGDVVVVTLQYRLGIFGFIDLDTESIPGNMGLFDQYTALKWIYDNIRYFGGDKESITLFGTSAGSISIGFHMFSPKASKLFKRAIFQSGSPLLIKEVFTRGELLAEKFTTMVGCYEKTNGSIYDEPELIVDCLDQTPFEKIYEVQNKMVENNPIPFMPSIPSEYIENFINDYNDTTKLKQKEVLMGFNLNEGALMIHAAYPKLYTRTTVPQYTKLKQIHQKVIDMAIDAGLKEGQASSIANIFIRGKEVDTPVRWAQMVSDLFSDVMFVCPTYEFANKLTSLNVTTYLYLFAQQAKNSAWGEWMKVTHHDEVSFIMGYPLRYQHDYSRDDIDISYQMIKTWAGFAKTGRIPQKQYPEVWRTYDEVNKYHMQIKAHQIKLGSNFHNESCDLYNLLSEYLN